MEVARRGRKRPRKGISNCIDVINSQSEAIETIDLTGRKKHALSENHFSSFNGKLDPQETVKTTSVPDCSRRSQPHRAARYTDSYSAPVESVILSEEEEKEKKDGDESSSEDSDSSDCEIIPISPIKPLTDEEQQEWEKKVQELQKELRSEEVKLALLRKLKHSQSLKDEKKEPQNKPFSLPPHIISTLNKARTLKELTITTTTAVSTSPTKKLMVSNKCTTQRPVSQDLKKAKPTSLQAESNAVNLAMKNEKPIITIQPITVENVPPPQKTVAPPPPPSVTVSNQEKAIQEKINKEISAQHQAAAKLALRKQLEKTLLQIPPPKPPAPELHFVPNATTTQFVYYLGLDIVVDFLTKTKRPPFHSVEPFVCAECKTDFTHTWRTIRKSKSNRKHSVICDTCYSANIKRSLKVEHTSRLKAAFVKALQQEKEIERLSSTLPVSSSTIITPSYTVSPETSLPSLSIYSKPVCSTSSSPSSSSSSKTAATTNVPNFFLSNAPAMLNFSSLSKLTQHQLQALIQAQTQNFMAGNLPLPAHMVPLAPFIPPYPFHMAGKSPSAQNDLQRQYLLDMIPPRRKT